MGFILRLFPCCLLLTSIGFSQSKDPTAPELSAFEQFVSQPGIRHIWSKAGSGGLERRIKGHNHRSRGSGCAECSRNERCPHRTR